MADDRKSYTAFFLSGWRTESTNQISPLFPDLRD